MPPRDHPGSHGLAAAVTTALACLACLACAACGSEDVPVADTVRPEHRDVIFEGGATDDALAALLASEPTVADEAYPYFATPPDGTELDQPLRFGWKLSQPDETLAAPSLEGRAFLAVFSTDSNDALLRVFTTELDYMPDDAAWARLTSTPETITGWLLTGVFAGDALVADGGPFSGGWIQLKVLR